MSTTKSMLAVGDRVEIRRSYGEVDMTGFAELTGIKPETVPEPLIAGLFSYLLGVDLPGPGTNYLKQDLEFLAPAPLGEELVASVEITRLRPEKHLVDLAAECRRPNGELVCRGRSLVLAKDTGRIS
jgi:acyl dehydratase